MLLVFLFVDWQVWPVRTMSNSLVMFCYIVQYSSGSPLLSMCCSAILFHSIAIQTSLWLHQVLRWFRMSSRNIETRIPGALHLLACM